MDYINENPQTLAEMERAAYITGDTRTADMLGAIIEGVEGIESRQDELDNIPNQKQRDADAEELAMLRQFFEDCFECLSAHYPCPEVSNEYDKSVIFDAIRKGEGMEE